MGGIYGVLGFLTLMKVIAQLIKPENKDQVISWAIGFVLLGGMAQIPFSSFINHFGRENGLYLNVGYNVLLLLIMTRMNIPKQSSSTEKKLTLNALALLKKLLTNPANWLCGIYTGLMNIHGTILAATWGSYYLQKAQNISSQSAAVIISMVYLGGILGGAGVGFLRQKNVSRKWLIISGGFFSILLVLPFSFSLHLSYAYLVAIFLGLGITTCVQNLFFSTVIENNPLEYTARAMSMVAIINNLIPALGNNLFSFIMSIFPDNLSRAFWLLPLSYFIAFLLSATTQLLSPKKSRTYRNITNS